VSSIARRVFGLAASPQRARTVKLTLWGFEVPEASAAAKTAR
jgi:hypothetical protein